MPGDAAAVRMILRAFCLHFFLMTCFVTTSSGVGTGMNPMHADELFKQACVARFANLNAQEETVPHVGQTKDKQASTITAEYLQKRMQLRRRVATATKGQSRSALDSSEEQQATPALIENRERVYRKVKIGDKVRVGVAVNPPLASVDGKGEWSGYAVDLFKTAAANSSVEYEFVPLPSGMVPYAIRQGCKFSFDFYFPQHI